jgi:hypothetical protein
MPLSLRQFLSRLLPSRRAAATLARIEKKLDDERRDVKSLIAQVKGQGRELDSLRATVAVQANRTQSLEDLRAALAREGSRSAAADQTSDLVRRLSAQLEYRRKVQAKWQTGLSWKVNALIRRLFLPVEGSVPLNLAAQRFKLRSQHEEDGYLLALLAEVGSGSRRFVEIGCGRSGGKAAVLAFELGWGGLMVDANQPSLEHLSMRLAHNGAIQCVVAEVQPETINALLTEHGYVGEVDLLSIDIDSYDYWVFKALEVCRPRVLMLEYNAGFGPTRSVTIPRDAVMVDAPKGYSGASLTALTALAAEKGYRLIACEYSGVNAFYLRNDVAPTIPAQPVERAFRPQMSRLEVDVERGAPDAVLRRISARNLPLQDV